MVKFKGPKKPKRFLLLGKVCVGTRGEGGEHTHARTRAHKHSRWSFGQCATFGCRHQSGSWAKGGGKLTGNTLDTAVAC